MAWSSAALSTNELNWYNADKPLMFANALRGISSSANIFWSVSDTLSTAGDDTLAAQPTTRLYDGFEHLQSTADQTAGTFYLHCDFTSTTTIEFDSICILNNNLRSDGNTTVTIHVSDDDAYTTNFTQIYTGSLTGATDARAVFLNLADSGSDPKRFSNVQFMRFLFSGGTNPAAGEIIIGKRVQFPVYPVGNYDPLNLESSSSVSTSLNNIEVHNTHYESKRTLKPKMRLHDSTTISAVESFFKGASGVGTAWGTEAFVWVDKPLSEPLNAVWVLPRPKLTLSRVGPVEVEWNESGVEQGPNHEAAEP